MEYEFDYFISYAHENNKSEDGNPGFVDVFVKKLKNSTEHKKMFGEDVSVFFDKEEISSMSDWDNRIRFSLSKSRFFVVLLSPSYFQSKYCAREFDWWMQHEMHRRVLGEGTAPMLIVAVDDLYNFNVDPLPAVPQNLQVKFPNWVNQIRQIQSGPDFDMHNLERTKIDEILRALCEKTKDKYFKQVLAEESPINAGYPKYNENFVGRRENLRSLRQKLSTTPTTAISAVNGLGGIGKTELALTYGHAFAWDYELGRIFATCENSDSLEDVILSSSLAEMHRVKRKGTNEQLLTTLYNALKKKIKRIMQRNKKRNVSKTLGTHVLLILDNVNRLELISQDSLDKLPDFFHVIITTRKPANEFPHILTESVDRLSEDESVELLSNLREFGDDLQEAVAARNIAKLLGGFTLAVELTGAYLKKTPYITYREQYDFLNSDLSDAVKNMVNQTQKLRRHQAECISVVLKSSLLALSDNARKALNFAALMFPDAVGFGWLPELIGLDENDVEGHKVLNELTGYCLLTPLGGQPKIARIHRLVADTVKHTIQKRTKKNIIAKIRKKCNRLLKKDKTFWYTSENSWNITPVFEFCLALAEQWKVEATEDKIDWNLTWALGASGDILNSLGKINEARAVFQRCFKIMKKRVNKFPDNLTAQRNLSLSYDRLANLEKAAGNAAAVREFYEKKLEIDKKLVDLMPDNVDAQRNLSIFYNKLGDLERGVGNAVAMRDWYEKALEIRKRLAENMPDNVSIQRDLSISYNKLGNLEKAAGNTAAARERYQKAMEIRKQLADNKPDNVDAQRCLSISYERLGDLEKAAGNAATARELYEKALDIYEKLAKAMPENVDAQRAPSVIYNHLGELEKNVGNIDAARKWYEKDLEIAKRLAEKMPYNVDAQRDLSETNNDLANLEIAANNAAKAKDLSNKALRILEPLVKKAPDDVETKKILGKVYRSLGDSETVCRNYQAAQDWYKKSMEIFQKLVDKSPNNAELQKDLAETQEKLAKAQKQP